MKMFIEGREVKKIEYRDGVFHIECEPYGLGQGASLQDACEDFIENDDDIVGKFRCYPLQGRTGE
jgi:hypothetical protein